MLGKWPPFSNGGEGILRGALNDSLIIITCIFADCNHRRFSMTRIKNPREFDPVERLIEEACRDAFQKVNGLPLRFPPKRE